MAWKLDTRMLRMMVALADSKTATEAASRLNITPSALSHQLRNAEEMLRVRLFERKHRRVVMTALGEQVLASARVILAELEKAEDLLERSRRSGKPTIRVSGGAYPTHSWFLDRKSSGTGFWPELDFVSPVRGQSLSQSVAVGDLDLAFACGNPAASSVLAVPLFQDDLVAVFPKHHLPKGKEFIEAKDIASETYITYSRVAEGGLEDELLFRPSRTAPAVLREAHSVEAILAMVAAGAGFTILSRWAVAERARRSEVEILKITPTGLRVQWSALVRDEDQKLEACQKVVAFVKTAFDNIKALQLA